jgi:solute carrier family 25 (mitochondrial phosphate transporter), member 23/24/25/41
VQVGIVPYAGADIAFFETLKAAHQRRAPGELNASATMAIGACSSAAAQLLSYPFALVRTRMQAEASAKGFSALQLVRRVWAQDGLKGFYRVCCLVTCQLLG